MGREEDSRGTTQIGRRKAAHFALTIISLPCNAGMAAQTTRWSRIRSASAFT